MRRSDQEMLQHVRFFLGNFSTAPVPFIRGYRGHYKPDLRAGSGDARKCIRSDTL